MVVEHSSTGLLHAVGIMFCVSKQLGTSADITLNLSEHEIHLGRLAARKYIVVLAFAIF